MDPPVPKPGADHLATLRAVARGRPEAVDAWYRSEHPDVYRLCFGFLANAAEAEDVAQDAMLKLMDNLSTRDETKPYRGWRNAVVLNLCRDRLRRNAARSRAHEAAEETRGTASLPDPRETLLREETRRELREALQELSPREREAFVLRDLEEHSTKEAAEILGVTPSSVRSLLTLARRRLRTLLAQRLPGIATEGGEGV